MWWCRCKGKTYHEIDGTIYNLGDLRHTARKRTENLHTRKSKLNPKPRGCLSLYGRPGNSDGGLVTSDVAAIGIMVVCNQSLSELMSIKQAWLRVVWYITTACLIQPSAGCVGESVQGTNRRQ
jgi:hypothetical protein